MIRKVVVFSLLLLFSTSLFAEEHVIAAGSDYKITLPSNWIEIPKDVLEQYEKAVREKTKQNINFKYGYQPSSSENWFEYPYALVQVNRGGRLSEDQFKEHKKIERGFKEGIDKVKASAGDILSNAKMGETIYDQDTHILWSKMSMDVSGVGRTNGLIAAKLTEYGTIQFMGYAKEEDFAHYETIYKKTVNSISVKESDIYKPRLSDHSPKIFGIDIGKLLIMAIIGALIGGAVGLFKFFTRKTS